LVEIEDSQRPLHTVKPQGVPRQSRGITLFILNGLLCDREWFEDAWNDGLLMAAKGTEKEADTFPAACPWTTDEIMNNNFYPD
jgi:hypothetical protein